MWLDKFFGGVLRVVTPLGPRYITPSIPQRILLLWIFRHFDTLPLQVLNGWQQRLIDTLCAEHTFVSSLHGSVFEEAPIIGTVERRGAAIVQQPPAHWLLSEIYDALIARWLGLRHRS